jgi:hypothetical protein
MGTAARDRAVMRHRARPTHPIVRVVQFAVILYAVNASCPYFQKVRRNTPALKNRDIDNSAAISGVIATQRL